jgi:hypothetical protein
MTNRHRLNRGGDRAANSALHMAAIYRMRMDKRTKAYVAKRTADGPSKLRPYIPVLDKHEGISGSQYSTRRRRSADLGPHRDVPEQTVHKSGESSRLSA